MFSAWDNKEYITGPFSDLTKVFDSVSHELLVLKLEFYAVKGCILNWLKCYLHNTKQRDVLQFVISPHLLSVCDVVKHGVPKESVLGPLMFNMYINDFPRTINKVSHIILSATDNNIIVSSSDIDELNSVLNSVLRCNSELFQNNQLVLELIRHILKKTRFF